MKNIMLKVSLALFCMFFFTGCLTLFICPFMRSNEVHERNKRNMMKFNSENKHYYKRIYYQEEKKE